MTPERYRMIKRIAGRMRTIQQLADSIELELSNGGQVGSLIGCMAAELEVRLAPDELERRAVKIIRLNPRRQGQRSRMLRDLGERDACAGRPIGAYYDLPMKRHNERDRASYEIGYRAAKAEEMLKARLRKP